MPIVLAAKLLKIPIIFHLRVAQLEDHAEMLKNADRVIAVSTFIGSEASKKDIEKDKIRVIYDGIDLQHFSRKGFDKQAMREEFGLPKDAKVVLNIARFTPYKRHDLLIAACHEARKSIPNLHLVLVGEVEDTRCYQAVTNDISKLGLAKYVTLLGFQRDIRRIEAAADAFVLCSDREPLGMGLMEGMAMGLPVVVTDSGGSHELVQHQVSGLITQSGNASELAANIVNVLSNEELATKLSIAARKHAEIELDIGLHAKRVIDLYEDVINKTERSEYKMKMLNLT
jgi:glycosyltransferase involved in cell wall biosynthesis